MQCECNPDKMPICSICGTHSSMAGRTLVQLGSDRPEKYKEVQILPELSDFQYTDEIKLKITHLYQKATNGKTKRNSPRRAIIFCCIISVCKDNRLIFDSTELKQKLDLKDKDINKIMKEIEPMIGHVNIQITMDDVIRSIMKTFDIQESCLADIISIYNHCKKVSQLFNSSKMETLAAGLVHYYLSTTLEEFNHDVYFEKSRVSKDTILLVSGEVEKYVPSN